MAGRYFDLLTEEARAALRACGVRRHWDAGEVLFHEGESTDDVVVVENGVVKAVSVSETGVEAVLAVRGAGDILGELSAVRGRPRTATVIAVDDVDALVVRAGAFREFLDDSNGAASALLVVLSDRITDAGRRQVEFGSFDTTIRLARLLAELAAVYGSAEDDGVHLTLLSQDELAGLCAASREAVARGLRTLRTAGLVTTGRRRVTITDLDALRTWLPE